MLIGHRPIWIFSARFGIVGSQPFLGRDGRRFSGAVRLAIRELSGSPLGSGARLSGMGVPGRAYLVSPG